MHYLFINNLVAKYFSKIIQMVINMLKMFEMLYLPCEQKNKSIVPNPGIAGTPGILLIRR